jgi:hypothetical protein
VLVVVNVPKAVVYETVDDGLVAKAVACASIGQIVRDVGLEGGVRKAS